MKALKSIPADPCEAWPGTSSKRRTLSLRPAEPPLPRQPVAQNVRDDAP